MHEVPRPFEAIPLRWEEFVSESMRIFMKCGLISGTLAGTAYGAIAGFIIGTPLGLLIGGLFGSAVGIMVGLTAGSLLYAGGTHLTSIMFRGWYAAPLRATFVVACCALTFWLCNIGGSLILADLSGGLVGLIARALQPGPLSDNDRIFVIFCAIPSLIAACCAIPAAWRLLDFYSYLTIWRSASTPRHTTRPAMLDRG